MFDPKKSNELPPGSGADEPAEADTAGSTSADDSDGKTKLTPEEQMAAYEEGLKNEDWGHQPC